MNSLFNPNRFIQAIAPSGKTVILRGAPVLQDGVVIGSLERSGSIWEASCVIPLDIPVEDGNIFKLGRQWNFRTKKEALAFIFERATI